MRYTVQPNPAGNWLLGPGLANVTTRELLSGLSVEQAHAVAALLDHAFEAGQFARSQEFRSLLLLSVMIP